MMYKGKELKQVTEPQVFIPPKKMFVTDELDDEPKEEYVVAIIENGSNYRVLVERQIGRYDGYQACFEIPEAPKPRRATNRELAKWLAQGNGELGDISDCIMAYHSYGKFAGDSPVWSDAKVRKWDDTEWHEPDVEYMGIDGTTDA